MDFRIELIPISVSDVDRAKDFYAKVGWVAEQDGSQSPPHPMRCCNDPPRVT